MIGVCPPMVAEIASRFRYPDYEKLDDSPPQLAKVRRDDRGFDTWTTNCVANHKVSGYAVVTLSLKPQGGTPGTARNDPAVARRLEGDPRRDRQ